MAKVSMLPAKFLFAAVLASAAAGASVTPANAVVCANGAYHAGCAGPNGAVGVRKYPYGHSYYRPHPYYGYPHCGPRGWYLRHGVRVCY